MTYSTGNLIVATDYNGFVSTTSGSNINDVWGTGSGDKGWGQTALNTVSVGNTITATQWSGLVNTLSTMGSQTGTTLTARTAPVAGNTISVLANVATDITSCTTNRGNAAASGTISSTWTGNTAVTTATGNGNDPWTITWQHTVTFPSANQARYFWNAGGLVRIDMSKTSTGTDSDADWNTFVSSVGTFYLSGRVNSASQTIAASVYTGFTRSGGTGTPSPNLTTTGWYNLTPGAAATTMMTLTNTASGYTNDTISIAAAVDASGTVLTLTTTWQDGGAFGPGLSRNISGGTDTASPFTTFGSAPAVLVRYVPPSTANGLSNTWGTPTVAVTYPALNYQIYRSLRLRSSASAYLSRTPATTTNTQTFTWSGWVKRATLSSANTYGIFGADIGSGYGTPQKVSILCFGGDSLEWAEYYTANGVTNDWLYQIISTPVFRDPSAWYHVVAAIDTTQATASNRVKLYVNGVQLTSFSTATYPPQNFNSWINNSTVLHNFGAYGTSGFSSFYDGYIAEANFIDGQQLTPSSFGQTDATTGTWVPIRYTGTYGTNGFYLPFTDSTSASTLCSDFSGNSNNWTPNNISIAPDATYDQMRDAPYCTGQASATTPSGNYPTFSPVENQSSVSYLNPTLSNANMKATASGLLQIYAYATMVATPGKYYFEGRVDSIGATSATYISPNNSAAGYQADGTIYGCTPSTSGSTYTAGDIIGVAFDSTNNTVTWYKNNVIQGTTRTVTNTSSPWKPMVSMQSSSGSWSINFGQQPFSYAPPSGYSALCAPNLAAPAIANGAGYMAASLYTGTGATQSVSDTVGSVSFKPDLVWIKSRSAATNNNLFDSVRGTTKYLISNSQTGEYTDANTLTAFGSSGFTVGSDAGSVGVNINTNTYVAWQWLAGAGTTSTNTNGSITSTVCVNTTAGFSIATWTGTGANATVGHGLGVAPSFFMSMPRTGSTIYNKQCWHTSLTSNQYLIALNSNAAQYGPDATIWNSTSPTSSVFSVGTSTATNLSGGTYVTYCFAPVAGFSAFGSYTGNGAADGPFVYLGFRPRFILIKRTDGTGDWIIEDTARNFYNAADLTLFPNAAIYESGPSVYYVDFLANGFKIRNSTSIYNASSVNPNYIFAAFAENPFNYSLAR